MAEHPSSSYQAPQEPHQAPQEPRQEPQEPQEPPGTCEHLSGQEARASPVMESLPGEDILQTAMRTIDTKFMSSHAPLVPSAQAPRFSAPNSAILQASNAAPTPAPKPATSAPRAPAVLTMEQLMAGLSKGNLRLASPTAVTADQRKLPITQILKMAKQQELAKCLEKKSVETSQVAEAEVKTENEVPSEIDGASESTNGRSESLAPASPPDVKLKPGITLKPQTAPKMKPFVPTIYRAPPRPGNLLQRLSPARKRGRPGANKGPKGMVMNIEYTDLTEPPEGYMCVFMPIKQPACNFKPKPILVPRRDDGKVPNFQITTKFQPPTSSKKKEKEVPDSVFCEKCKIWYSPRTSSHIDCILSQPASTSVLRPRRATRKPRAEALIDDAETSQNDDVTQMTDAANTEAEQDDDAAAEGVANDYKLEEVDDTEDDADFVGEEEDDDDEDDDYKPSTSSAKRKCTPKTKSKTVEEMTGDDEGSEENKGGKEGDVCEFCKHNFDGIVDHSECSTNNTPETTTPVSNTKSKTPPSPTKRASSRAKAAAVEEIPNCSVCNKPYNNYDQHRACSGVKGRSERNQRDGQMRSVEIQRVKRRRRVHRFLKLNFLLNPEIPEPPETEWVGGHKVKDDDDLLEEHFTGGEDRPPLGLTCYVCSEPFENDIKAYHHYTDSKCGPKYIGKILFRSKNRAENRPNNIMTDKTERETKKPGQKLKRNYYNAFTEQIVDDEDGSEKKNHICTACGDSFANAEAVKEHYSREHRWRCKLCGDIYVHMKGVQLHYNRSHGKSYCVLCHVLFDSAPELQTHMRTHQKRLCDLCGQVLANKHHYNKHMLKQHNIANAEPLHHEIVKMKPQPRGLCEICGKEYSWPFLKSKHMRSHFNPKPVKPKKVTSEEEEGELDQDKSCKNLYPFRCDICSRGFQRVFYYNQHLERHAKGLACDKCGLFFSPQVDRGTHLAECVDNICADCGERCATKEALKRHKQTHPGQETCKICHRQFATKFLLKNHAQTHKQYQCKVCAKRFPSMDHVNKHKCFGKKFQCKICGEKFSSIKMSKQHAKTQHNSEGMDVFTKKRVEFELPDEATSLALMAPMAGPSHVSPVPSSQPSMTAHEVSQALMTLHDFPMQGYNPVPLNIVRTDQRDQNQTFQVKLQQAPAFSQHPNHPPPGYPGSYF